MRSISRNSWTNAWPDVSNEIVICAVDPSTRQPIPTYRKLDVLGKEFPS